MVTLDGVERTLTADDLLICDATDTPIGIGGIMGGLDSEISDATTTIALEIAWFEPIGIAKTATGSACAARRRCASTAVSIRTGCRRRSPASSSCCGSPAPTSSSTTGWSMRSRRICRSRRSSTFAWRGSTRCSAPRCRASEIAALISRSRVHVDRIGDTLTVSVPSWRPDCTDEVDIIEEVARQYGYANIGKTVPKSAMHGRLSPVQARRRQLREVLLGLGLNEAMPNPFLADDDLVRAGLAGPAVRIVNSLVAEESVLRTSLRPGLLKAIAFNESHRRPSVSLFEIGHVYPPGDGDLPDEYEQLGVVLAGRDATAAMEVWREVAAAMGFGARVDQSNPPAGLHPTRSATLSLGRDAIGAVGEVHPDVLDAYGVDERVAVLELNLTVLLANEAKVGDVEADQPFPVERPRSRVHDARFGHRREGREGDQASGRRAAGRRRPVRRVPRCRPARRQPQPGLSAAAAGPRPHPQRRRVDRGAQQGRRRRRQARRNASLIQR